MTTMTCPRCGEGTIVVRVFPNWEGDPGVIGGVHHFTDAEIEDQECGCELTNGEIDKLCEDAINEPNEPDEPDALEDYLITRGDA